MSFGNSNSSSEIVPALYMGREVALQILWVRAELRWGAVACCSVPCAQIQLFHTPLTRTCRPIIH